MKLLWESCVYMSESLKLSISGSSDEFLNNIHRSPQLIYIDSWQMISEFT